MGITKYTGSTNIFQLLSDRPNQNEGFDGSIMKAKFDQPSLEVQTYIDDVLTVEIDEANTALQVQIDTNFDDIDSLETLTLGHTNDISDLENNKTDKTGNHLGTWRGLEPVQSEPGIQAVVNENKKRKLDWINVVEMGADNTGNTDCSTLLQSLLNTYPTLYFPTGTYLISTTLNLNSNNRLIGNNKTSKIISADGSTILFYALEKQNIFIQGIETESKRASFSFEDCNNIVIDENKITLTTDAGINAAAISYQRTSGSDTAERKGFRCTNNEILTSFLGILTQGKSGKYLRDITIKNNLVDFTTTNIADSGECLKVDYYTERVIIEGNRVNGGSLACITVEENTNDVKIINNCLNAVNKGIRLTKGQTNVAINNLIISQNIIIGGVMGIQSESTDGVYDTIISDNIIIGQTTSGIQGYFVRGKVTGNIVRDTTSYGIHIRGQYNDVTKNKLYNSGLRLETSLDTTLLENVVTNNIITVFRCDRVDIIGNINRNATTAVGGITVSTSGSELRTDINIIGNIVKGTTNAYGIYISNDIQQVVLKSNVLVGTTAKVFISPTNTIVKNSLDLVSTVLANIENNQMFIDSVDNKLKFKDNSGVVNLLY